MKTFFRRGSIVRLAGPAVALLVATAPAAVAQLEVRFAPPYKRQLLMEPVLVKVYVKNLLNKPVRIEPEQLGFRITENLSRVLTQPAARLIPEAITIQPFS